MLTWHSGQKLDEPHQFSFRRRKELGFGSPINYQAICGINFKQKLATIAYNLGGNLLFSLSKRMCISSFSNLNLTISGIDFHVLPELGLAQIHILNLVPSSAMCISFDHSTVPRYSFFRQLHKILGPLYDIACKSLKAQQVPFFWVRYAFESLSVSALAD